LIETTSLDNLGKQMTTRSSLFSIRIPLPKWWNW
jgi:hypothetical protein